jgi:hypothetical protein
VRGLLKCRTSTACSRSAEANSGPPRNGCRAKTKFRARRQNNEAEPDQLPRHRFASRDDPGAALAEVGFVASRSRRAGLGDAAERVRIEAVFSIFAHAGYWTGDMTVELVATFPRFGRLERNSRKRDIVTAPSSRRLLWSPTAQG